MCRREKKTKLVQIIYSASRYSCCKKKKKKEDKNRNPLHIGKMDRSTEENKKQTRECNVCNVMDSM